MRPGKVLTATKPIRHQEKEVHHRHHQAAEPQKNVISANLQPPVTGQLEKLQSVAIPQPKVCHLQAYLCEL